MRDLHQCYGTRSNRQTGSVFGIRTRILQVKLSYKNPLFQQIFHDFHLFLKMIPNKSYLLNKIPTFLVENKNEIPFYFDENKNFSQNFVIVFEKMCFWPGFGLEKKIQDPD